MTEPLVNLLVPDEQHKVVKAQTASMPDIILNDRKFAILNCWSPVFSPP